MEKTLYIKDNSGKLRYWTCREALDGLEIEHGVVGGTPQYQYESIEYGKAGRNQDEQIASRIESRANKQLDKGYVENIEVARTMKPLNRLGFCKPMLAKKREETNMRLMMSKRFYLQHKLDGNRCLIHNDGIGLVAYTRNGKLFTTLDHILRPLENLIPAGYTLDGELYIHGMMLQSIVSLAKRKQKDTEKLQYHVYDLIADDGFGERYGELSGLLRGADINPSNPINLVKTTAYQENTPLDLSAELALARAKNYEGLMFRSDYTLNRGVMVPTGYEDGKRSYSLVKCKDWDNQEFTINDVTSSADGWAILHCMAPGGEFTVSCPGDVPFKRYVLMHKNDYIGKQVSVDFAYWTDDNKPFHPTATSIRDYE